MHIICPSDYVPRATEIKSLRLKTIQESSCVRWAASMDDLLRELLTETIETLDAVDVELMRFEQEPNNVKILANIFRLVHTIKGTCGFLNLPRLEALTHAAEALMGN